MRDVSVTVIIQVNMSLQKSDFDKEMYKQANYFPWQTFKNSSMKRQFKMITDIGTSALEDKNQLKEVLYQLSSPLTLTFAE